MCVVLQADPSGPSFQTLFNNTEQTLKVGDEVSFATGGGGVHGSRGGGWRVEGGKSKRLLKLEFYYICVSDS